MTLLSKYSSPSERQRGLIFAEKFESVDAVFKNGATIGAGTPTFTPGAVTFDGASMLTYDAALTSLRGSHACTVLVETATTSIAGQTVFSGAGPAAGELPALAVNGGNWMVAVWGVGFVDTGVVVALGRKTWIGFTYAGGNAPIRSYCDGVAGAASAATTLTMTPARADVARNLLGGYIGSVYSVRVFDQELSPEEILQYAKGTLFDYISRPSIYLPMRNVDHTATQTLDVSGNGRHATVGAGVPVKLTTSRGYDFDGSGDSFIISNPLAGSEAFTIAMLASFDDMAIGAATRQTVIGLGKLITAAGDGINIGIINTKIEGWLYGLASVESTFTFTSGYHYFIAVTHPGGSSYMKLYVDGKLEATSAAVIPAIDRTGGGRIGMRCDAVGNDFDGRVYQTGIWNQCLTQIQIYDLMQTWQMKASET
jgi:hypothetical protein